jgi:phage anti-repressor protein
MSHDTYELEMADSIMVFEFVSEGPKGLIRKRVHYQKTIQEDTYNLAMGDVNSETDKIDFQVVTDNNDTEKVLATVAKTVYIFIDTFPEAHIYAKGGNSARNRLYRIGISNNLEAISKQFAVYGLLEGIGWVPFEKNINYLAFTLKLKY